LGFDTIVGDSLWDRQSKLRIRIGPLTHEQFAQLLPDKAASETGPRLGKVAAVARFYLNAELDFDLQLVLAGNEVPPCQLADGQQATARLGWNTWVPSRDECSDRDDAIFAV
jgi:type VI secretion system protein ImpH